jgi:hypothetical protein
MIPKSEYRFPACAKLPQLMAVSFDASAGEARSDKIMLKQMAKAEWRSSGKAFRFSDGFNSDQFSQGLSPPGLSAQ